MSSTRLRVGVVTVLAVVALAGCGGFLTDSGASVSPTLTPAPVPDATEADGPETTEGGPIRDDVANRYARLEPNCERPPGLVVHIQVEALATNDPGTDRGIRTVWRFAAPSNRQYTGPFENFAELIKAQYEPLLAADRVAYGPVNRTGDRANRLVSVASGEGNGTYRWHLARQSSGRFAGCWMTTGVRGLPAESFNVTGL